jgi:hypothetical protein
MKISKKEKTNKISKKEKTNKISKKEKTNKNSHFSDTFTILIKQLHSS